MNPQFWHNRWSSGNIGFHNSSVNELLIRYFHDLNLKEGSTIFVPLCGKTLDIGWLIDGGYKVVGVELNESAVKELFKSLKTGPKVENVPFFTLYSAKDIDIFVGDIFKLNSTILHNITGAIDGIYDRAALVALPKYMRGQYTSLLVEISNNAPQLLNICQYNQNLMQGPPFCVNKDELKKHYKGFYKLKCLHRKSIDKFEIEVEELVYFLDTTIKQRAYLILKEKQEALSHTELVNLYVEKYPNFDKNYKDTKKKPKAKISGTIDSVLRDGGHKKIKIDKSTTPHRYYIDKQTI